MQHLNCKTLHTEGDAFAVVTDEFGIWQQFGKNFAPNSDEDQNKNKKGLYRYLVEYSDEN